MYYPSRDLEIIILSRYFTGQKHIHSNLSLQLLKHGMNSWKELTNFFVNILKDVMIKENVFEPHGIWTTQKTTMRYYARESPNTFDFKKIWAQVQHFIKSPK